MQKFYTASGRLVLHDEHTSKIFSAHYVNDQLRASRPLFTATPAQVTAFMQDGTLRPFASEAIMPRNRCPEALA